MILDKLLYLALNIGEELTELTIYIFFCYK